MQRPLISFLAPIFNKVSWCAESIVSLQTQTLKDIEIVFIDDGSTDGTTDIIKFFQKTDDRIKLFRLKKNMGLGVAWNAAHKIARADIVCVASGDDIWEKDRAQITYDYFQKHKNKDVFYGAFWYCDSQMNKAEFKPAIPYSKKKLLTPRADGFSTQFIGHFVAAYKTRVGRSIKLDEGRKWGVDYEFFIKCAKANMRFGWTNKILGYARRLESSVSFQHRQAIVQADHKLEGR